MIAIKCDRCGEVMRARNEEKVELKWTLHECKGQPDLGDLPFDILRKLAYGEITETEAWQLAGDR